MNFNMDDIFNQFFGKQGQQGGGSRFQFNMGGGGQQRQEVIPDLFENTDVYMLDLSSIFQFYRRQEIWLLYFFDARKDECKQFKDEYVKLAEKLYGIVKVGAVDCVKEEELCEEFGAYDIPQLLVFNEELGDEGERYRGKLDVQSMATAATKKMQSFVSVVNIENYSTTFVERDRLTKNKILLFTDKKSTPAIYKALSKRFKDRLMFGEVRKSEEELCKLFGVTEFPTILAITDPENMQGDKYTGDLKVD